jgi:archaemetzincin
VKPSTYEALDLVQVGGKLDLAIDRLKDPISTRYPWFRIDIAPPLAEPADAYDSHRNQYHSTRILALLESHIESLQTDKILGVTTLDLFVPGMNFVFGEARLPGKAGVVSTSRLKPPNSSDQPLLEGRIVKEAVHEVGHMLGLNHCSRPACVMHFSERLTDTDLKSADPCESCQSQLRDLIE